MDPKVATKEQLQASFLETKPLLQAIMSGSTKSLPEGLKDSVCEQGNIVNRPQSHTSYIKPADLNKKQEKTKIKVELPVPDVTNYKMAPFQAGNNEDYVTHIIVMHFTFLSRRQVRRTGPRLLR